MFKLFILDVHFEMPCVVTNKIIQKIEEKLWLTDEQYSEKSTVSYETVSEILGFQKLCTHWIQKILIGSCKKYT